MKPKRRFEVIPQTQVHNSREGMVAHVLGNGPSRLQTWRRSPGAVLIACNAAYRDLEPDYLVASDVHIWPDIAREYTGVAVGNVAQTHQVHSTPRWSEFINISSRPKLYPSGSIAIWFACWLGCKTIECFGFDGGLGNVYEGSEHYENQQRGSNRRDSGARRSWEKIRELFPDREFIAHGPDTILRDSPKLDLPRRR